MAFHIGKLGQPSLSSQGPALIRGFETVGFIKRPKVDFNLVPALREYRGTAPFAEIAPAIFTRLTLYFNGVPCKHRCRVEQRTVVAATVHAVADADANRSAMRHKAQITAGTPANMSFHCDGPL